MLTLLSDVYIGEKGGGTIWPCPPSTPWLQPIKISKEIPTTFFFSWNTMEIVFYEFENFVIVFEFLVTRNRDVMQYFLSQPILRNALILCNDLLCMEFRVLKRCLKIISRNLDQCLWGF